MSVSLTWVSCSHKSLGQMSISLTWVSCSHESLAQMSLKLLTYTALLSAVLMFCSTIRTGPTAEQNALPPQKESQEDGVWLLLALGQSDGKADSPCPIKCHDSWPVGQLSDDTKYKHHGWVSPSLLMYIADSLSFLVVFLPLCWCTQFCHCHCWLTRADSKSVVFPSMLGS